MDFAGVIMRLECSWIAELVIEEVEEIFARDEDACVEIKKIIAEKIPS